MDKTKRSGRQYGRRGPVALAAAAVFVAAPLVRAADTWTGAVDATWDTAANWSTTAKPNSTDLAIFPSSIPGTGSTITLGSAGNAQSLSFDNSYTLTGSSLTLAGGGIAVSSGATATIGN